jgi:aminoglycoside phosphotransferase family enzyme
MTEPMREASTTPDQSEVFSFLNDPKTFGAAGSIRRIDTHGAVVFLVGDDAYKVKRAVRFPFMDFSTLEKRRRLRSGNIRQQAERARNLS